MRIKKNAFSAGVHPPHRKDTNDSVTQEFSSPSRIVLPLLQHIGAPCDPMVMPGDRVLVGQMVADNPRGLCVPIYSPVSGTVKKIADFELLNGQYTRAIEITPDGLMERDPDIAPPQVESHADFVEAVRRSGLVGLGGAGFPTYVKLNPKAGTSIDTLVINAAECEPYITSDYRECMESTEDVLDGIEILEKFLALDHAILAVEKDRKDLIRRMREAIDRRDWKGNVTLRVLPVRYPQGAEKVIVNTATGRVIEPGQLPADVGVLVMNVTSVAFIARFLRTGEPLVKKRITVSGDAVAHPGNVWAPIGTPVGELIDFMGGFVGEPAKLIVGGPMMGQALHDTDYPVLKQTNAVLALPENKIHASAEQPCIRCGACIRHCPMSLSPCSIRQAVEREDIQGLRKLNVMSCIECGACAFSCPAGRYLVQSQRQGKAMLKKEKR